MHLGQCSVLFRYSSVGITALVFTRKTIPKHHSFTTGLYLRCVWDWVFLLSLFVCLKSSFLPSLADIPDQSCTSYRLTSYSDSHSYCFFLFLFFCLYPPAIFSSWTVSVLNHSNLILVKCLLKTNQ